MQTSDLNVNNTGSDHTNAIFRQFQDAVFSTEHTYVKTLTKIIFDLLQWQETATLSLPKKAVIATFIWTTFRGHFRLGANDISRNRSRVIFSRACADIFRRWNSEQQFNSEHLVNISPAKNVCACSTKNDTWSISGNVIASEAKMPGKCSWDERSDGSFFWQWQRSDFLPL